MNRKQNVIIFSAGESVRNGKVAYLEQELEKMQIHCVDWHGLFALAHNADQIALLPNLIKKIPTFDFALVVAEGVDTVSLRKTSEETAMRDNVIFELGLCIMALGADRVILLAENSVRIPEDLDGVASLGVTRIAFDDNDPAGSVVALGELLAKRSEALDALLNEQIAQIVDHIRVNAEVISPVFVGAAVSSAEAYFLNFVIRLLACMSEGAPILSAADRKPLVPADFRLRIIVPSAAKMMTPAQIRSYYAANGYREYLIENTGTRSLSFRGRTDENGCLTVADIPTSVTASYILVNSVLNLDADEEFDRAAEARFTAKEMDLYTFALRRLLTPEIAEKRLTFFSEETRDAVIELLSKVSVENEAHSPCVIGDGSF